MVNRTISDQQNDHAVKLAIAGVRSILAMGLILVSLAAGAFAAEPAKQDSPQAKDDANCIEQFRRVCSKVRLRKCRVVMKEDCAMRPANRCRDRLVEKCVPQTRQVCRNVGGRTDCRYETKRRCQRVIRQVCDRRLERRCKRVPRTVCTNEPETRCEQRRFYSCSGKKNTEAKKPVK